MPRFYGSSYVILFTWIVA